MAMTQKQLEYQRQWRKANPDKYKKYSQKSIEYTRQWRINNPEMWKAQQKRANANYAKKVDSNFDLFVNHSFTSLRNGAKARNLPFNITKTQLRTVLLENTKCAVSGRKVEYKRGNNKASIDRIDNRYGYSLKNIQVVTAQVNLTRMGSTLEDFVALAKDIAKHSKKK
jgi:hypothetical protein